MNGIGGDPGAAHGPGTALVCQSMRRPVTAPFQTRPGSAALRRVLKSQRPRSCNPTGLQQALLEERGGGFGIGIGIDDTGPGSIFPPRTMRGLLDFSRTTSRAKREVTFGKECFSDVMYDMDAVMDSQAKHIPQVHLDHGSARIPLGAGRALCTSELPGGSHITLPEDVKGVVPMEKVCNREQRAKSQAYGKPIFDPTLPYYSPEMPQLHVPGLRMDRGAKRMCMGRHMELSEGQHLFYDKNYRHVEADEGKGTLPFGAYTGREQANRGLRSRGRPNRKLDIPLHPKFFPDERHHPSVSMEKQVERGADKKLGRTMQPDIPVHYNTNVLLRPKYSVLDKKADRGVPFCKATSREQTAFHVNKRRANVTDDVPPAEDIYRALAVTKPKVKGYVSMMTQASRYDRPASRFGLHGENESLKRTMYYSPEDKFSLNQYVAQDVDEGYDAEAEGAEEDEESS
eukprot:GGOE01005154.1.p1 GENE.GGOE01005154.1~~GGOE01005154.1.p1  ORF type:complete len:457 (+),score=106.08 GGOE01005154.1:139-1509(+)